jgi:2-methylcitrate dehydratase PrpD
MLMHTNNQGDSYRMLAHPGACVIPAALTTAELDGRSGKEFIAGVVAGYEVECRIAGDFIPSTQAQGFRTSPVYGVFGATAAAAKVQGLDEDQAVNALGWATSFAAGIIEGGHAFHEPAATRNGLLAARVGQEGFHGADRAFEAKGGFYKAFTGDSEGRLNYVFHGPRRTDVEYVAEDLGERWESLHVIMKIPPTPGFNCPIIELIKDLRRDHGIEGPDVESMQIAMNWLETSYPTPAFVDATPGKVPQGGTPFVAAYTALYGDYPMMGIRANQMVAEDTAVRELMGHVEVLGVWDRTPFAPRVTMQLRDGRRITGEYHGNELEWDFATELKNLTPWFPKIDWPQDKLNRIVELVTDLEKEPDMSRVIAACVP